MINVGVNNNDLIFTVADNGMGIDSESLDKIFERFIQLDDTINRKSEGNGIGLSLVKSLVKLHNGKIDVESEVNVGTKFIVSIPITVLDGENTDDLHLDDDSIYLKSTEIEFSDII